MANNLEKPEPGGDGGAPGVQALPAGLNHEAVRGQVQKIVSSPPFAASTRISRFLRFAVDWKLEGRANELKEYVLGLEVFDRSASFDPRIDPIVRVEARRLRSKLASYYEKEGLDDELIIEFPKGTYAPCFRLREAESIQPRPASSSRNIAVLPFANLSAEPDSDYFSDGLTEELIHALTKVEGLRVVAWTTAARFRDQEHEFRAIGRQLNVDSLLAGSVRQSVGRLRVVAKLIDTSSGYYLWSETYDRRIEDLFAIQEEISTSIVRSLQLRLAGRPLQPVSRTLRSPQAYDLYLRGRFYWGKRTAEGLERGIQLFNRAIEVDPQFAPAHAGLADALSLCADFGLSMPAEVMPKAKAAALRALELDPSLAEAHTSLGLISGLYEWRWLEAERHYRRALELNPGYATAHHWYACDYLALVGRCDEALAEMETAVRLDPLCPVMIQSQAYVLMLARRYDEALEVHRQALELDAYYYKSYTAMGRLYIQKGLYGPAAEMLEKGLALAGDVPNILGALGQAYALGGRQGEARALLVKTAEMARQRYVPSTCFALIHAGLGEVQRALDWLEAACERHEPSVCVAKVHPAYDSLRGETRFTALLKRMGLESR